MRRGGLVDRGIIYRALRARFLMEKSMHSTEQVTRLNCEIPDSTNDKLNIIIPRGSKSDIIRALINLFIAACSEHGREFVIKLLDGKVKFILTDGT